MPITRIPTPMTKILADQYIAFYCSEKEKGSATPSALTRARFLLQEFIIQFMIKNPSKISEIETAYQNIKEDDSLREKAIIIFDLNQCDESVKSKYMPLFS
jgi:hypothetical protein